MSQVSYGTITITDTNDIESITVEYNRNQSSSSAPSATDSGWSTTRPDWAQGYYIWQRTRVHKSGTTVDKDVIGTAVCITGSTGSTGAPGRGLTDSSTQYCNYGTGEPANNYSGWVDAPPSYDSSKPNYWVMITNTYSAAPTPEIIKYKDEALTKAVADAAIANSIATHANENAQGALSISRATQQHFWFNSTTSGSIEAGAYITDTPIDTFKNGKSGGYLLARSDGLELGRGTNKFMTLSATALNFYRPGTTTIDAQLTSTGLNIANGSIELANGTNNSIKISNSNFTRSINSISRDDLRMAIGDKFGVASDGTLYASGAKIAGDITVSKLTVNSGATISDTNGLISNSAIEVGGRNLLLDTKKDAEESHVTYDLADFNFSESVVAGEVYTVSAKVTTSEEKKAIGFYHSGGQYLMNAWQSVSSDGLYNVTFTATTDMAAQTAGIGYGFCRVYASNTSGAQGSTAITGTAHVDWIKLEKGNIATDWTPAPEDVDTNIVLTAEGFDNRIDSLSERITGVASQQSLFEDEVDNKFTNIRGLQTAFEKDTLESLKNLEDAQSTFASISELSQLQKFINEYIGTDGYITSGGDAGNPYLEIGKKIGTASFYVRISSTEMGFYQNGVKVAYINSSQLYITNSEVLNEQRIGAFNWKVEGSNRMSLVYSPK